MKKFTAKRSGTEIGMRTFGGKSGKSYLVFRERDSIVFHVFTEVEAKEAAQDCGADTSKGTTASNWTELWDRSN